MEYLCPKEQARAEYAEKKSRFIAYVIPLGSEEEAALKLEELWKEHQGARHIVWAWRFGVDGSLERYSDDGEPSGTAGKPILGLLRGRGLSNVMVAVVRYFGGVLLGTGGLLRAYSTAAGDALDIAGAALMEEVFFYKIALPYSLEKLMRYECGTRGYRMDMPEYGEQVVFRIGVTAERREELFELTQRITNGSTAPEADGAAFLEKRE